MKIGMNSPTTSYFAKALGAVPAVFALSESYTALERGIADAWMTVPVTLVGFGQQEVANYIIDHGWYHDGLAFLFNPETWNALPPHLQQLMEEVILEVQQEDTVTWLELTARDRQVAADAGVEVIKFSPADAEWYIELAYSSYWEDVLKKDPVYGPRFYELMAESAGNRFSINFLSFFSKERVRDYPWGKSCNSGFRLGQ